MTADHIKEQLNCAIETFNYVLKKLDRNAVLSEQQIREALRWNTVCDQLSQQELDVVAAYIYGLAEHHINYRDRS